MEGAGGMEGAAAAGVRLVVERQEGLERVWRGQAGMKGAAGSHLSKVSSARAAICTEIVLFDFTVPRRTCLST